ncbi:MAG: putative sulfate exporter family transporter [Ideonella sp.]|nr:putative sulfate exporter family transporter [Ideonella sp.]
MSALPPGGEPAAALTAMPPAARRLPLPVRRVVDAAHALWPGVLLCAVVAMAAQLLGHNLGGPAIVYALLLGLCLHGVVVDGRAVAGIAWCSGFVLRVGVALLGLRITLEQLADLGPETIAIVLGAVATTIGVGLLGARALGLTREQGVLTGGASAICGASAALAIAAALPSSRRNDRYTLLVVLCVSMWSTAAMVVYPLVAKALDLPPAAAGLFLGGSIQDVAQVVGAATVLGAPSLDAAVVVKLLRVSLLVLVVMAVAWAWRASAPSSAAAATGPRRPRLPAVPVFLAGFVALLVLGNLLNVPPVVKEWAGVVSGACMLMAIAGLGLKTELRSLWGLGWRPLALVAVDAVWIATVVLVAALVIVR